MIAKYYFWNFIRSESEKVVLSSHTHWRSSSQACCVCVCVGVCLNVCVCAGTYEWQCKGEKNAWELPLASLRVSNNECGWERLGATPTERERERERESCERACKRHRQHSGWSSVDFQIGSGHHQLFQFLLPEKIKSSNFEFSLKTLATVLSWRFLRLPQKTS